MPSVRKPKVFYGYRIVLVAFFCLFVMSGCGWYAFGLFVKSLQADLGWNRGEIMAAFTIMYLIIAGTAPFVGRIVDRYGAKRIISTGAIITGLGFIMLTQMSSLWQFYLGYTVIGIGLSASGQVPATAVVSNWFKRKRGQAIGLMSMAVGGGGFAIAPLVGGYLIPTFDWRVAYLALAILTWVLIIPLTLLVLKTKPEEMGLYPDGAAAPEVLDATDIEALVSRRLTLRMAVAMPAFWLIAVAYFASNFGQVGAIQNQSPHLQDIGFPIATVATALGTVGLVSAIGKFIFGSLCDRIPPKYAYAIGLSFQLAGIIILINIRPDTTASVIWLYAILTGLGSGSWLPTMSMITSTTFGLASYGAIFGGISLLQSTGTACGPLAGGFIYDVTGSYGLAFIIYAVLTVVAIPMVLLVRRPSVVTKNGA